MAVYQFLFGSVGMIILLSGGCHSVQPVCGRATRNTRIIGGASASAGTWPWLASLSSDGYVFCGGSLITKEWVLTAAHCLTSGYELLNPVVHLGRLDKSGPNVSEVSRGLERIVCHPSFVSMVDDNDICLVKLSAPVEFTNYIRPVCLASAGSTFHPGVNSWVSGFGVTEAGLTLGSDVLQEVNLPIVGNNECRCAYPELTDNMICAGFREGGKDACQGDSGGPLLTKKHFMWIQGGIVSFGYGCARPMTPGVYTSVSQYQDWITSVTDNSEPSFVTYRSSGVDSDLNFTCSTGDPRPFPAASPPSTTKPKTQPTKTTRPSTLPINRLTDKLVPGGSGFDGGGNVIFFSHFTSICFLVISLFVLVGEP